MLQNIEKSINIVDEQLAKEPIHSSVHSLTISN